MLDFFVIQCHYFYVPIYSKHSCIQRERSSVLGKNQFSCFRRTIPFWKTEIEIGVVNITSVQSINKYFFDDNNHILKFFIKGFKNLPSSFFLILEIYYQVLTNAQKISFRHSKQDGR